MVKKFEKHHRQKFKNHIKADVIILGCSLPGIIAAHNLKKKFGNSMDIVVLDLATTVRSPVKTGVDFHGIDLEDPSSECIEIVEESESGPRKYDNVARYYLTKYASEFKIHLPRNYAKPSKPVSSLNKLFQYKNGSTVGSNENFHDFGYLNFVERFELEKYQKLLDHSMQNLFQSCALTRESENKRLLSFDQTTMESHLCDALVFPTSREIMRNIVGLVCGTTANNVSVLFYLYQCYRSNSSKNHVDGDNTRFREKLLDRFMRRLAFKLQESIADITVPSKPIRGIRTSSDERVILEPTIGETDYICNLLAMALRPDELKDIELESKLNVREPIKMMTDMTNGKTKRFLIEYKENFWRRDGFSGDILSIKGPIVWAMERPKLSGTRPADKYAALVGYLKVRKHSSPDEDDSNKDAVIEQLVKLFGEEAREPVTFTEMAIDDIFVPRCGDYVALRKLTTLSSPKYVEWGALDIFADGDVASAIEAGHTAYVHLMRCLRPQALTFEDVAAGQYPINLVSTLDGVAASVNFKSTSRVLMYGMIIVVGVRLLRSYLASKT